MYKRQGYDYYVSHAGNLGVFDFAANEPVGYKTSFLFHVQTSSKLVNGASEWKIERDDKGNQTNDLTSVSYTHLNSQEGGHLLEFV